MAENIKLFAIKTCIVAVVISACTIFVADWIIGSLEESALHTVADLRAQLTSTEIGGRQFWSRIERELDRAADPSSDLPPEKKQKLIKELQAIVARWRPFVEVLQDQSQASPKSNDGKGAN